jgi:hypothetical protein
MVISKRFTDIPYLALLASSRKKQSTKRVIHKGKCSETRMSSLILVLYFLSGGQVHYSETALSEAHNSEGYLYMNHDFDNTFNVAMSRMY